MQSTRDIGYEAETKVCNYLSALGYSIHARNFMIHNVGEIDIIAGFGKLLLIVEVKARSSNRLFAGVNGLIDKRKYARILKTADLYIQRYMYAEYEVKIARAYVSISPTQKMNEIALNILQ